MDSRTSAALWVAATFGSSAFAGQSPSPISFAPPTFLIPGHGVIAVESPDIDNDGDRDLIVANLGSDISIFRNLGNGTFSLPQAHPIGSFHLDIAIADFNGDGFPDIATANFGAGSVSVAMNAGDGGFGPPQTFPAPVGISSTRGLAAGDLDGDADVDLIVGDAIVASKGVLLNDGRGGFEAHPFSGGGATIALALGDLDGDGDADCISVFAGVFIHLNNGDATFAPAQPFGPSLQATAVCIADVNADSHLDVAVLHSSTSVNQVGVFLNTGRDAAFTFVAYPIDTLGRDIAAADLDADGDLDIATSHVSSIDRVNVLRNDGSGTFAAAGSFFPGTYPQSLTIADFDQDGLNDIATANEFADPPNVGMLVNDTIVKSIGDVTLDGQVNVDDLIAVILAWGPCPPPPCAADVAPHPAGDGAVNVDDLVLVILNWG